MRRATPKRWFKERELVLRTDGRARSIKLGARVQLAGAALLASAGCAALALGASLTHRRMETRAMQVSLSDWQEDVAHQEQQVAAYRDELDETRVALEKRQAFLERMVQMLPEEETASADPAAAEQAGDKRLRRIGAVVPEANGLARLEQRQLAAVSQLTAYAEGRAARTERAIRGLGLDPRGVMRATSGAAHAAMGGPLEALSTEADGSLDPRFERLGASLARLAALEAGLERVPQVMPTAMGRMTSNFGYRRDPFTGGAAMHSGLDFGGRTGDPIRAAAAGRVSFVGTRSGYGNVVEITHGNGLLTRYAHMSAWKARAGQQVAAGEVIGAIGSTGRSTGPHLHFEVRINGAAVNPRPLLEGARDALAEVRS